MNLHSLNEYEHGVIKQFTPPACYELAGQRFELAMDDGYDFVLNIISGDKLEWSFAGEAPATADYMCRKADDTTYLLSYELTGAKPRVNHTFVLDKENMLVTRLLSKIGTNPKFPYLMKTDFEFGAIRTADKAVTLYPRHGFTSDMLGNVVTWRYGLDILATHVYYSTDFYRVTYPLSPDFTEEGVRGKHSFDAIVNSLPSTDEPAQYIKIKDGMYLFNITEKNGEKLLGEAMGFRSNTMCFLQNYKRVYQVGRSFGTSTTPAGDRETHIMFGAFGVVQRELSDELRAMLTDKNPYLV